MLTKQISGNALSVEPTADAQMAVQIIANSNSLLANLQMGDAYLEFQELSQSARRAKLGNLLSLLGEQLA
jgi:hypothetical protein